MRRFKLSDFFNDPNVNDKNCSVTLDAFLDAFYYCPSLFSFIPEPKWSSNLSKEKIALVVTVAHALCDNYGFFPPSWIMRKCYKLDEPYYLHRVGTRLHAYTTFNALEEGVIRNVFVTDTILKRV